MAKKKRKRKIDTTLTLGDVVLDLEKAYQFIGEEKHRHAKQAISRARTRLNAIRGVKQPKLTASKSQTDGSRVQGRDMYVAMIAPSI